VIIAQSLLYHTLCIFLLNILVVSHHIHVGLDVECTAVERPDVNVTAVRALALSLGAATFSSSPYFP
jgi:hypothetical protein